MERPGTLLTDLNNISDKLRKSEEFELPFEINFLVNNAALPLAFSPVASKYNFSVFTFKSRACFLRARVSIANEKVNIKIKQVISTANKS